MKTHELKTWPRFFGAMLDGTKVFEARRNDRDFQVGDELWLREWEPYDSMHSKLGTYTGRELRMTVTYILHGSDQNAITGIAEGFCVLAVKRIEPPTKSEQEGVTEKQ